MKKLTTEEFIKRANKIHDNKYDYSNVLYINAHTKVKIICPRHNTTFSQSPNLHAQGQGCPICGQEACGKKQQGTTEKFIQKFIVVHGDKYDYSEVEYVNIDTKVNIICSKHKHKFYQRPDSHLSGSGCNKCGIEFSSMIRSSTTKSFIRRSLKIHNNKYSYENTIYTQKDKKVLITCPEHGDFSQVANSHLQGNGCPQCAIDARAIVRLKSTVEFIKQAQNMKIYKIFNYDYSKFKYVGALIKGTIICPKHGEFEKTPSGHLNRRGCPVCSYNMSHGERQIATFLYFNKIKYTHNKTFADLLGIAHNKNSRLRYDFYLPKFDMFIEYDGIQHFEITRIRNITLEAATEVHYKTVKYDKIKNEYAKNNGYKLHRIPYTEFNNIEDILNKLLF